MFAQVVKKIIDEENIPTETRRIPVNTLVDGSPDMMTSAPAIGNHYDTDDSFHSAVGENDTEPLLGTGSSEKKSKAKRRALGCIKNHQVTTPKSDMRRKLWRNMKDERVKKGVNVGLENTPPLPFNDITASAPPKLCRRKYS